MIAAPNPAQSESSKGSLPVKSLVETVNIDPAELKSDTFPSWQLPLHKRIPVAFARFLITFCIGIAVTLAWQSYGDAAREMIVNSYPQLGWLAPQAKPVAQSAPKTITLVAPVAHEAPSLDQQPLSAISLHLDAVQQSVDRIAAGQEQITRNVDQLAAAQEQTTRELSKLQAIGQYILYKNSEPRPPQVSPQVSTPRQSQARTPR